MATLDGNAALLDFPAYLEMAEARPAGAAAIEDAVLGTLGRRIRHTDKELAELLESRQKGTWVSSFKQWFSRRRES